MKKTGLMLQILREGLKDQKGLLLLMALALGLVSLAQAALLFGTKGFMRVLFQESTSQGIKLLELLPWTTKSSSLGQSSLLAKVYEFEISRAALVYWVPGYFLAAGFFQAMGHYYFQISQQEVSLRLASHYRNRLMTAILRLPYLDQKSRSAAQWMSLVMNDVVYLQNRISELMTALLKDSLLIVVSFASLWIIHWPTALVVSVLVPMMAWGMGRAGRKVSLFAEGFQLRLGRIASSVHDLRQRFDFVRSQKGQEAELRIFRNHADEYFQLMSRSLALRAFFAPSLEWVGMALLAVLLMCVGSGLWSGFQGEDLLQLMVALGLLAKPSKEIGEQLARYHETKGILSQSIRVFMEVEKEAAEVIEVESQKFMKREASQPATKAISSIQIDSLSIGVKDKILFKTLAPWSVNFGTNIAIIGPSGAGKTTLMRCLAGLIRPKVWSANISWQELILQGSFVSQDPFLFHDTIRQNLIYALEDSCVPSDNSLWEALEFVGLKNEVLDFSLKLETPLLAFSHNVSGGQLQRLVIARALLRGKKLLLLDEATSAIDSEAEKRFLMALTESTRKESKILVAITHRLEWLEFFDQILFVEDGKLYFSGNFAQLSLNPRYQEFCRAHVHE